MTCSRPIVSAVSFFDVICWRDLAENIVESIPKGTRVIVTGRLDQRSWEGDGGEKRSKVEITADEIGPSLRWATAEVSRTERVPPGAAPTPRRAAPPAGAVAVPTPPEFDYSDEPF